MKQLICRITSLTDKSFDYIAPVFILITRVYLAKVFFFSGLTKIQTWSSTLYLFQHEYRVPLLSPEIAAYLGTAAELILPVLIILGLGSRLMIFALFLFNLVATLSYEFLWTDSGAVGLTDHLQWGLLIMMLLCTGYGKLSLDYLLERFFCKK